MTAQIPLPARPLQVSGLTVARDGRVLFENLDFAVDPGGVLLVRGPNGAGKSSLLLTLAGLLRPETGTIDVAAGDEPPGRTLHFLGHRNAVKPRLTLSENLKFWVDVFELAAPSHPSPLRGGDGGGGQAAPAVATALPPPSIPPLKGEGGDRATISDALAVVGLGGLDHHDAGHLSQGQSRRLALARLIVVPRPVWLLDEPTAALDAGGEDLVATLVRDHRARGGVAVVATHHDLAVGAAATLMLGV